MPELNIYTGKFNGCFGTINEKAVKASDLEDLLEKGVVVYGKGTPNNFSPLQRHKSDDDNLEVLIISLKPIENQEPVSREEIEKIKAHFDQDHKCFDVIQRILKQGFKP